MYVRQLELKQFRCFKQLCLDFDGRIVLISGPNGSGKTSILEALHYLCYLRSFRASSPRHLIRFGQEAFFLKICLEKGENAIIDEVQAGFSSEKRLVRLNKRPICSYKELLDHYRIVTITEDAIELIKGGPVERRSFLDQALLLGSPEYMTCLREYHQVLENRNKLLQQGSYTLGSYILWMQQLWKKTMIIQQHRKELLQKLSERTNKLLKSNFDEGLTLELLYKPKRVGNHQTMDSFLAVDTALADDERRYGRSLFGAHLDEVAINFQAKKSRIYASRGQQKLIMMLLKIAQLQELAVCKGPSLLVLDDFMTDFDKERVDNLITLITGLEGQIFFVSPLQGGICEKILMEKGAQRVELR